jgi:hypothetical protein
MITARPVFRNASTSGFVISPRNTVAGFMAGGQCYPIRECLA